MPDNRATQASLALARGIEAELGAVVHAAERTVILLGGLETSGMEENQLRNVLNVAQDQASQSVPVVVNFIRYQIGRARTGKHWQYNGFGLQVIDDVGNVVAEAARRAVSDAAEWLTQQGQTADEAAREEMQATAHTQLVTDYLGFLNRAFVYIRKTNGGWERLRDLVAERAGAQTEREESDA